MLDKKISLRLNLLFFDKRFGFRLGSFGLEKNFDFRLNSFGFRFGFRFGFFKVDQKIYKSFRLGRYSFKISLVFSEVQKSGDRKVAKQSDDNQYIDYELGFVDIYVKIYNFQVGFKDGECNIIIVLRSTV